MELMAAAIRGRTRAAADYLLMISGRAGG